jgi:DNA-binding transcriptional regulator YiaG
MPNIATALKAEISRIARKEVRAGTASLQKSARSCGSQLAALRQSVQALERAVKRVSKVGAMDSGPWAEETPTRSHPFSAKRLASHRRRLGLSANDLGRLLGVSGQSVYNWEEGKARPRALHMPAIAALGTLGKRVAAAHLASRAGAG